jgi:RNA polymerase sigma-32 factor
MSHIPVVPAYSISDLGLESYLKKIQQFPMLTEEEEYTHAKKWSETQDPKAVASLLNSHLRLVAKIAFGYRGYGLPMEDLIAEGNMGMLMALKKFDPDKGYRFSTYARWWIQASIQDYILKSWSLVKIGTTAAQKKLFFNLRSLKKQLGIVDEKSLSFDDAKKIAKELDVSETEVIDMDNRLRGGDSSLNAPVQASDPEGAEWQDWLEANSESHEDTIISNDELKKRSEFLKESLQSLSSRELQVLQSRRLTEPPLTLEELSQKLHLSKERVRQIEVQAFKKIRTRMVNLACSHGWAV